MPSFHARWLSPRWPLGLLGLFLLLSGARPVSGDLPYFSYLPLVLDKPCLPRGPVLFGCVEVNGARMAGVSFSLLLVDNVDPKPDITVATATSDSGGYFDFGSPPTLSPSNYYFARYQNFPFDPARVGYWDHWMSESTMGPLGVVDLTNISLHAPADGLHVTLPYTFSWGVRPTSPGDNYAWLLFDPDNHNIGLFETTGHDGYVRLNYLQGGLQFGKAYVWQVSLDSSGLPDHVRGSQFWHVTFDSLARPQRATAGRQALLDPLALARNGVPNR